MGETLSIPFPVQKRPTARDGKNLRSMEKHLWAELYRASQVFGYRSIPHFIEAFCREVTPHFVRPIPFEVLRTQMVHLAKTTPYLPVHFLDSDATESQNLSVTDSRWTELLRAAEMLGFNNRCALLEALATDITPHFKGLSSIAAFAQVASDISQAV